MDIGEVSEHPTHDNNSGEKKLKLPIKQSGVISESQLRAICKDVTSGLPFVETFNPGPSPSQFHSLFDALLLTAESAQLSASHKIAACNAICAFLDQGSSSCNHELRSLCFAGPTWNCTFNLFLERLEDTNMKPMRQVLTTLTKLLSRNLDSSCILCIKKTLTNRLLSLILRNDRCTPIKPAFHALEHFISKQTIDVRYLLLKSIASESKALESALGNSNRKAGDITDSQSLQDLANFYEDDPSKCGIFSDEDTLFPCYRDIWQHSVGILVRRFLYWMSRADVIPIAGRLLSSLFGSLRRPGFQFTEDDLDSKLWAIPLYTFIKSHPDLLEPISQHVLPELLQLHQSGFSVFLGTLPISELQYGNLGHLDITDIRLMLDILNIAKRFGLASLQYRQLETATVTILGAGNAEREVLNFPEADIARVAALLLDHLDSFFSHASPSVRLAALNHAVSSRSQTEPVAQDVLLCMQRHLGTYHAESDTKLRNLFISVMGRFLKRLFLTISMMLRVGNSQLLRSPRTTSGRSLFLPSSPDLDEGPILQNPLTLHVKFVVWYIRFLGSEMQPTASYQRHISALKIFQLLQQIGLTTLDRNGALVNELGAELFGDSYSGVRIERLIADLIMDSFDDVRDTAECILKSLPPDRTRLRHIAERLRPAISPDEWTINLELDQNFDVLKTLSRAHLVARSTGRADHADGVGRCYGLLSESFANKDPKTVMLNVRQIIEQLLFDLKVDVEIANRDLRLATSTAPLHSHLVALRHTLSQPKLYQMLTAMDDCQLAAWRILYNEILDRCAGLWDAVKDVLCIDSPEGNRQEDVEDDDLDIGIKDTLSFSWRAIRESSSLMYAMVLNHMYGPLRPNLSSPHDDLRAIGSLAFTQLAELRHRGAFSTVSQTFATCCAQCARAEEEAIRLLPERWYKEALALILNKSGVYTRRSAGIPAMITGILSADLLNESFHNAILDLQAIADAPARALPVIEDQQLPQVHALNSLRAIFTHTLLSTRTEPFLGDTLSIAADCLKVDIWAIQNCGLMLLRALLTRLLGRNDVSAIVSSKDCASRMLYEKFPNLPDIVQALLNPHNPPKLDGRLTTLFIPQEQSIFPALEIIQRAGIPLKYQAEIKQSIRQHLGNSVWYIREKAAKTICHITDVSNCMGVIDDLLLQPWQTQNALHGRLLCVRQLLALLPSDYPNISQHLLKTLFAIFKRTFTLNRCPITRAAYILILEDLFKLQILSSQAIIAHEGMQQLQERLWGSQQANTLRHSVAPKTINFMPLETRALVFLCFVLKFHRIGASDCSSVLYILIRDLAQRDTDALYTLLSGIDHVSCRLSSFTNEVLELSIMTSLCVINRIPDQDIQAIAMRSMARFFAPTTLISYMYIRRRLMYYVMGALPLPEYIPLPRPLNIQFADGYLRLWGTLLCRQASDERAVGRWAKALSLAGHESNELELRLATVISIEGFQETLRPTDSPADVRSSFLGVYLVLYDVLNDDDPEIRGKGASIVSWILSDSFLENGDKKARTDSLSPFAAKDRLLDFLIQTYKNSRPFGAEALQRLVGARPIDKAQNDPCISLGTFEDDMEGFGGNLAYLQKARFPVVRDSFQKAMKSNTALFAEEKQNLFIDSVGEARHWAHALLKLSSLAISSEIALDFETWTMDGLAILLDTAQITGDGPLGWTSKPEIFKFGASVIYAAGVVMYWADLGIANVSKSELQIALERLHKVGESSQLQGLWLRNIEALLRETVIDNFICLVSPTTGTVEEEDLGPETKKYIIFPTHGTVSAMGHVKRNNAIILVMAMLLVFFILVSYWCKWGLGRFLQLMYDVILDFRDQEDALQAAAAAERGEAYPVPEAAAPAAAPEAAPAATPAP